MNPFRPRRRGPPRHPVVLMLMLGAITSSPAVACDPPIFGEAGDDAGTIVLREPLDGSRDLRLAGIALPPGGGTGGDDPADRAAGDAARHLIADALQDRCIRLERDADATDRYGRLLAQVYIDDTDVWLQGALLAAGLARVRPTPDERARIADMLAIEIAAREAGAGMWRDRAFEVRPASEPARIEGGFRIVEGRVLAAERRADVWYLNFGREWRSDFTVTIPKEVLPTFARAGIEPFALQGRSIRVRGWVQPMNGPMIELVVPEQIEVLDAARVPADGGR